MAYGEMSGGICFPSLTSSWNQERAAESMECIYIRLMVTIKMLYEKGGLLVKVVLLLYTKGTVFFSSTLACSVNQKFRNISPAQQLRKSKCNRCGLPLSHIHLPLQLAVQIKSCGH